MKKLITIAAVSLVFLLTACTDSDIQTFNIDDVIDTSDDSSDYTADEIDQEIESTLDEVTLDDIDFDDTYEDYTSNEYTTLTNSNTTISVGGTYLLEGSYSTTIVIDVADSDVTLILNNADIQVTSGPAILVLSADDVTISAVDGTNNTLEDSSNHPLSDDDNDYNAVIYSTADLLFNGSGSLTITANYNNAINTKDDLKIIDLTLLVTSVDDGLIGRDSIAISNATITIDSDGDGMQSTNDENTEKGYIYIESGSITIDAGADAIQAVNNIMIKGGTFYIEANDKGIQSATTIIIGGGDFTLTTIDDALNSDSTIEIYDGTFIISTTDDAIHADTYLLIEGGDITITMCYEGLESREIEINGGTINLNSTDDGLQAQSYMSIGGGIIQVSASGDGFDVNGSAVMTDGYLIIFGPTSSNNGALDYDGTFNVSGGLIIALGSTGMAMAPSSSSSQASVLVNESTTFTAGTTVTLSTSDGTEILSLASTKYFGSVMISSSALVLNNDYVLDIGSTTVDFTQTSTITTVGDGGGFLPDGGTRPRR